MGYDATTENMPRSESIVSDISSTSSISEELDRIARRDTRKRPEELPATLSVPTYDETSRDPEKPHPSELLEFTTIHEPICREDDESPTRPASNNYATSSNDDLFRGLSDAIPDLRRLSADARMATEAEHRMTFLQGCRLYPKAILWSALLSSTIIMEGFDTTLITSFFAFPIFRRNYGQPVDASGNNHQISVAWQTGLQNGMFVGEIIGLFCNGFLTDRFGYHRTMIGSLIAMSLFVFLAFFAYNIEMLLAAQVSCTEMTRGLPLTRYLTGPVRHPVGHLSDLEHDIRRGDYAYRITSSPPVQR